MLSLFRKLSKHSTIVLWISTTVLMVLIGIEFFSPSETITKVVDRYVLFHVLVIIVDLVIWVGYKLARRRDIRLKS